MSEQQTVQVAAMNQRVPAFLIDILTHAGISSFMLHLVTIAMGGGSRAEALANMPVNLRIIIPVCIILLSWFVVFVMPTVRNGQTMGMRMTKCKLFDFNTLNEPPTLKKCLIRELFVFGVILPPLGLAIILTTFMNRSHRNILDKWSHTILLSVRKG
jgi:uncharacterized RDD family membrane protein YckC